MWKSWKPSLPSDIFWDPSSSAYDRNVEAMASEVKHLQEIVNHIRSFWHNKTSLNIFLKIEEQQLEVEHLVMEAKIKVVSIRRFWRDKIFREQSRAVIMIKRVVCS